MEMVDGMISLFLLMDVLSHDVNDPQKVLKWLWITGKLGFYNDEIWHWRAIL